MSDENMKRYSKAECLACIDTWMEYIKKNIEGGEDSDSFKTFQQIREDLEEGAQIMESNCCGAYYYLSGLDWRCRHCYKVCKIVDWGEGEE